MSGSELAKPGWYSRRHRMSEPRQAARARYGTRSERQQRRRASALARRESQLVQYMLGVFDRAAGGRRVNPDVSLDRAQTEIDNLRGKLGISV